MISLMTAAAFIVLRGPAAPVRAQDGSGCRAQVADSLRALDAYCRAAGRDTLCLAVPGLTLAGWSTAAVEPLARLTGPAAVFAVGEVQTVSGSPLTVDGPWGLGLLRLRVDAPDTAPAHNLSLLLLGDVRLANTVPPAEARPTVTPIDVQTTAGVNLRDGPGTTFAIVGGAILGQTLAAIGRDAAGTWLQVGVNGSRAWVSAEFVTAPDAVAGLPVTTGDAPPGSWQRLTLRTGSSAPPCREAPPDHVLVHAPAGLPLAFTANGVTFQAEDATFALTAAADTLTATVFAGGVTLTAGGSCAADCTAQVMAGYTVDVPLPAGGTAPASGPGAARPLDPDAWIAYLDVWGIFPAGLAGVPAFDLWALLAETGNLPWDDVEITLRWTGPADLDLTVTEPNGTAIYYGWPESGTGGQLAADAGYPCAPGDEERVEQVTWPTGQAPVGDYHVRVDTYDLCGAAAAPWTLSVRLLGQTALYRAGDTTPREYTFSR